MGAAGGPQSLLHRQDRRHGEWKLALTFFLSLSFSLVATVQPWFVLRPVLIMRWLFSNLKGHQVHNIPDIICIVGNRKVELVVCGGTCWVGFNNAVLIS